MMPSPENLRLRLQLIAEFDQLAERLANGDETAIEKVHDHLAGLMICDDTGTLGSVMKALATVLTDMQEELDECRKK